MTVIMYILVSSLVVLWFYRFPYMFHEAVGFINSRYMHIHTQSDHKILALSIRAKPCVKLLFNKKHKILPLILITASNYF